MSLVRLILSFPSTQLGNLEQKNDLQYSNHLFRSRNKITCINTFRKSFIRDHWALCALGVGRGGLQENEQISLLRENFRTQTIWVQFCHKNIHIGYPKHYIPKLCLFFLEYIS